MKIFRGELSRSFIFVAMIFFISKVLVIATNILLARNLGVEAYGSYTVAISVLALLVIPSAFGFPTYLVKQISSYTKTKEWSLLRGLIGEAHRIVICVSICILIMSQFFLQLLDKYVPEELYNALTIMLYALPVLAVLQIRNGIMLGAHHVVWGAIPEKIVIPGMMIVILILSGNVVFFDEKNIEHVAYAYCLALGVAFGIGVLSLVKVILPTVKKIKPEYKAKIYSSTMPFIFVSGVSILNSQIDVLMLGFMENVDDAGVYKVGAQCAEATIFFLPILNAIFQPYFSKSYVGGETCNLQKQVFISSFLSFSTAFPIACGLIIFGDSIIGYFFGYQYSSALYVLFILTVSQLISAGIGAVGPVLNMTGNEKCVIRALMVSISLNIGLNIFLIPLLGALGASISYGISIILWNFILAYFVKKKLRIWPSFLGFRYFLR